MSERVETRYILKDKETGLYMTDKNGNDFTKRRGYAREWKENYKPDEDYWQALIKTGQYAVIQITETTTVKYEEVPLNE